jgi:uncharacterized protein HemY
VTTVSCHGAIARPLGRLASLLGDYGKAEVYFRVALDLHARLEAPYWTAVTQLDYADMLVARDAGGDVEQARELSANALATARQYGCAGVEARATQS